MTLASALSKIGGADRKELPPTLDDELWEDFRTEYKLSLRELSALKIYACSSPSQHHETPQKRARWIVPSSEGWTPGTVASRAAVLSFVEEVGKTGFFTFVAGKQVDDVKSLVSEVRGCAISLGGLLEKELSLTEQNMTADQESPALSLDLKTGLLAYGETQFQQSAEFQESFVKVDTAHVLDNANASAMGPFFTPLHPWTSEGPPVYEKKAKVDATSKVAPMDLEMKGRKDDSPDLDNLGAQDWQVLKQAAERSRVRLLLAGYLQLTVAFAVTNRSAWCVIGKRSLLSTGDQRERVELCFWRIDHEAVLRLWMGVTRKAIESPFFFLTPDGPLLWTAFEKMGFSPWLCRAKLIASCQSNVYGVSVGNDRQEIDARTVDYALKIVRADRDNYPREVEALEAMARVDKSLYAIAHLRECDDNPTLFGSTDQWKKVGHAAQQTAETASAWWWQSPSSASSPIEGGVIIMKHGAMCGDDLQNVCLGVCSSLRVAHQAGVLHCDIRKSNVLYFQGMGWRLIDFGLSCRTNDTDPYELEIDSGAQAAAVGPRVAECLSRGKSIHWSVNDDYEMAMKMFNILPWSNQLHNASW